MIYNFTLEVLDVLVSHLVSENDFLSPEFEKCKLHINLGEVEGDLHAHQSSS